MPETAAISPDTTMEELLAMLPGAQRALFRLYHIGGCASCGFQREETLQQVCERNGNLPVDKVIAQLFQSHAEDQKILIEPEEAAGLLRSGAARFIDIRTREEFDAVHIEGSEFFTNETMQEALLKWDRTAPIVIVDHKGARSMDAAAYFAGHGFERVRALRGGIDRWSREVDASLPRYHLE